MRRYEGMDELLRGVRERLQGVKQPAAPEPEPASKTPSVSLPVFDDPYALAVKGLKTLLHDAESIREEIAVGNMTGLTEEQRDHLLSVLHKVMEELWSCEASLQGVL